MTTSTIFKTISLSRLDSASHVKFHSNIATIAKGDENVLSEARTLVEAFSEAVDNEFTNFNRTAKSEFTPLIRQSNQERGQWFTALKLQLRGLKDGPSSDSFFEAAAKVYELLEQSGIDTRMSMTKETARLNRLLEDLQSETYASYVATLNLTSAVNQLSTANTATDEYIRQRTDEKASKTVGAAKSARAKCDECFRDLLTTIKAAIVRDGQGYYDDFVSRVNAEIAEFKQYILRSSTSDASEASSDAATTEVATD